jgi:hypothetical protein
LCKTDKGDGYIVTKSFVLRFNALVDKFGKRFTPEIKHNFGIQPIDQSDEYFIVNQAMVDFLMMNTWNKSGK